MKRLIMFCVWLQVLAVAFVPTAKTMNSANVNYCYGEDVFWDLSPACINTGYSQYGYGRELTQPGLLAANTWYDCLSYISPHEKTSFGTAYGLSLEMLNQRVGAPGVFDADIHTYVDASRYGHVSVSNIYFSSIGGSDATGLRHLAAEMRRW